MITLDGARATLDPFAPSIFVQPVVAAVDTWHDLVTERPAVAAPLDATTRANMIHNWIEGQVRQALVDVEGIREVEALGFFAVAVGANPLVRYKLLVKGRAGNVPTDRQRALARHQYDEELMAALTLEGIPQPPALLTCGYSLDAVGILTKVEICCHYGKQLFWSWPVWGDEAEGGAVIEQATFAIIPAPEPARIVSARRFRTQEAEETP